MATDLNCSSSPSFRLNPESAVFVPSQNLVSKAEEEQLSDLEMARQKAREEKIMKLVEFYVSDENLLTDSYLQYAMATSPDDYIKLNTICSFNRMKKLKASTKRLAEMLMESPIIQLSDNAKSFRRKAVLPSELLIQRRSLIVERVDSEELSEAYLKLFPAFSKVVSVSFRSVSSEKCISSRPTNYPSASPMLEPASPFCASSPINDSLSSPFILPTAALPVSAELGTNQAVLVFATIDDALKALEQAIDPSIRVMVQCASFLSLQRERDKEKEKIITSSVTKRTSVDKSPALVPSKSPALVATFRLSPNMSPFKQEKPSEKSGVLSGVFGGRWRRQGASPAMSPNKYPEESPKVGMQQAKGPDGTKGFTLVRTK